MLAHEKLDVYRCAIDFLALASRVLDGLPRGQAALADQLRRAAMSIPLNIAESAGCRSDAERRRYLCIARGSAMECSAILDVCRVLALTTEGNTQEGKALLVRLVSMLTRMTAADGPKANTKDAAP
jgi:four helix bundle protein